MLVASAASRDYRKVVEHNKAAVIALGYEYKVYDLGGLGQGQDFREIANYVPTTRRDYCRAQPISMRDVRYQFKGPIVWLHADCILHARLDELKDELFDVAFVVKRRKNRSLLKLKVDFVYLNDTHGAYWLVDQWSKMLLTDRSDGRYLNNIIESEVGEIKTTSIGKTIQAGPVRIKLLDLNYAFDPRTVEDLNSLPDNLRVLHLKVRGAESGGVLIPYSEKLKMLDRYKELKAEYV